MASLTSRVARGAAWMVAMRLSVRLIGLASTLILLRLLEPQDFGIVAMATAVAAAIDVLRQFGFDIALIQNPHSGPGEYNTVWTLDVLFAVGCGALIALIAKPAAVFYSEPALVPLFYVIATITAINGLQNVGIVDFRKYLQFNREFHFLVAVKVIGFIVTIGLATWLRSYWALVLGMGSMAIASVILSYTMHPYRPRLSLVAVRRLFRFSKWIFINNISNLVKLRGADFVIGRIAGTRPLGLFTLAYEISNLPTSELVAPINRALLPGFSQISGDSARSSRAFVRAAAVMALLSFPMAFGISATAELLGTVVLGEKWLDAVPLMKILALSGAITAILSPIASALISLGKPRIVATMSLCNALTLVTVVIFLTQRHGAYGAVFAILVVSIAFLPIYFFVASRYIRITRRDLGAIFVRPGAAATAMYIVVISLPRIFGHDALHLLLSVGVGASVYVTLLLGLWVAWGRPQGSSEAYVLNSCESLLARNGFGSVVLKRMRQPHD